MIICELRDKQFCFKLFSRGRRLRSGLLGKLGSPAPTVELVFNVGSLPAARRQRDNVLRRPERRRRRQKRRRRIGRRRSQPSFGFGSTEAKIFGARVVEARQERRRH